MTTYSANHPDFPRWKEILENNTFHSPDGCWYWTGCLSYGYGTFGVRGVSYRAHRVAFIIHNPSVNIKDLCICHSCDNRLCINPNHLFLGTIEDNVRDRTIKGRTAKGERHHDAKLSEQNIRSIRQMKGRVKQREIAKIYSVSQGVITRILNGKSWKHVQPI